MASRRGSDEEHLEPKFELPIPPGSNIVTARGMALINAGVAELEAAIAGSADELAIAVLKRDLRYWQTGQIRPRLAPAPELRSALGFSWVREIFDSRLSR